MEDVQYSKDPPDSNATSTQESVADLHPPQETKMHVDPPFTAVEGEETILEVPTTRVEVVIEKVELEPEEPILPDHYYDDGNIPVFKPTMDQFANFEKFITRINEYGMKAGIVKVIPPPEWKAALPALDERVKEIRLRNAIEQQFAGSGGVFRQTNIEKRRVYNLPQWRELCESTDHQPPARRGEVRTAGHTIGKRKAKPKKSPRKKVKSNTETPEIATPLITTTTTTTTTTEAQTGEVAQVPSPGQTSSDERPVSSTLENEQSMSPEPFDATARAAMDVDPPPIAEPINRPTTPVSPPTLTRKRRRAQSTDDSPDDDDVEQNDFDGFDYRISNPSEYTVERCKQLEKIYWKTITFNNPLYGADMPGSLFDDSTETWNVAKLDNLLCRIGKLIPGVNSAYLYLGMWKATFSWHVEDMDLYSINYIHFGAPKQWYSINQSDADKFESLMRSYFPNDHKGCPQFMRHKTFLASPSTLESKGIKVNRLVHHEGEFVITFPFGYHSGYNLGYNCAESVNFATEDWLDIGRRARKCNCAEDSVNINVDDIIDAIRGVPMGEYDDEDMALTPPDSLECNDEIKKKRRERKKLDTEKKIIIKKEKKPRFPCMLCPNDPPNEPLLPTAEPDKFAHRICAEYVPETWIYQSEEDNTTSLVAGTALIAAARWTLKCLYCSSTRGVKFQCSMTTCCRAYHATCAAAAGVLVETVEDAQGVVSSYQCRYHRPRRPKVTELEDDVATMEFARGVKAGDTVQARFGATNENDTPFVGTVVENCESEEILVIELATGELFEVAYKWVLPIPKRDLRALCALQSVPGSTKQRKKYKKKGQNPEGDTAITTVAPAGTETQAPPTTEGLSTVTQGPPAQVTPTPMPLAPIPQLQPTGPSAPNWSSRNPGFAQYHQYVWQIQQQNSNLLNTDDAFHAIMQKLQTNPPSQSPQPGPPPPIILPPPQFNMGQPPPSLLPAKKEIPLAPKPSPPAPQPSTPAPQRSPPAPQPSPPAPQPSAPVSAPPSSTPRRPSGAYKFCSTKKKWVSLPPTPTPSCAQSPPEQWRDQFSTVFYRSPVSLSQSPVRIAPAPSRTGVPTPPMPGPFRPLPPESGFRP